MTRSEIEAVLRDVAYRDWQFYVGERHGDLYLQVRFLGPDSESREIALQSGRKWLLSSHMTRSEIVRTALKAVLAAEEHEARERFTYRGRAVFGPHLDVDVLARMARVQDRKSVV